MQEHLVSPYAYLPCTGTYHSPNDKAQPDVPQLGPVRQSADGHADRARVLVRHVLLPTRRHVLLDEGPRAAAAEVGAHLRLRLARPAPTSARRRRASCRRSAGAASTSRRQIDKLWKPGNSIQLAIGQGDLTVDAAADGALLRAARERRQARHAARADGRREPERDARAGARTPGAARGRRRPCGAPDRPEGPRGRRRTSRSGRRIPSSARSPSRSPARRARRRRSSPCRATSASRTSPGGAATGRRTPPSSSSAP